MPEKHNNVLCKFFNRTIQWLILFPNDEGGQLNRRKERPEASSVMARFAHRAFDRKDVSDILPGKMCRVVD